MSIKKKLGMGIATLSLGAVMALGGTFAAFNDVERANNSFAAGYLNLEVDGLELVGVDQKPYAFRLSNLKPGDSMTRTFELKNIGTLAIKEVLLTAEADSSTFVNGVDNEFVKKHSMKDNNWKEFLDQFEITIIKMDPDYTDVTIVESTLTNKNTLLDLVQGTLTGVDSAYLSGGKLNLAGPEPGHGYNDGIPASGTDESDTIEIKLTFKDDPDKVTNPNSAAYGEYKQNVYQGDAIDLTFFLEATQWDGIKGTTNDYHSDENRFSYPVDEGKTKGPRKP